MKYAFPVAITVLASAIGLTSYAASAATRSGGKVPGLHITAATPPGYGSPRVPRVVRGFNPNQKVRGSGSHFAPAPRR